MLQRLVRPQGSLRAASSALTKPASSLLPRFQTRNTHYLPQLVHNKNYAQNGISEFMSPEAYDFAWTQYQSLMIDKLNLLTQDTADADVRPGELVVKYAKRPEMASVFNYASMASNNHFFFNCLSPHHVPMPGKFADLVVESCSSVESLKLDFLATASSMFGPGYVWLAKNLQNDGLFHIFCTYNAGSPWPAAFSRRQPVDMATQPQEGPGGNKYAGSMGQHSRNSNDVAAGGVNVHPILCVNTWEHVWMMDYGIAGKDEYLERWWDRINWEHVSDNYNAIGMARAAWSGLRNRVRMT